LLLAATAAGAADVAFVSPHDGEVLAGDVQFQLHVRDGADVARVDVYVAGKLAGTALPPSWSFVWSAPALVAAPIVAIAFDAAGRPGERARIKSADRVVTEWVDVNAVQLYPVVTDRGGRYIRGLGRSAFTVIDSGKPVPIDYFSESVERLRLAILLDTSRSMTGKLSFVAEAAQGLLRRLEQGDAISLYAFNHGLEPGPQAMAPDLGGAESFVRGLVPSGGTALYDALSEVLHDLEPATGRKAILLFSDGQDERSLLTLAQVVDRARQSEAIIYAVGAGSSERDVEARRDLETLARETGGQALFFDNYRKLDSVFDSILVDLRSQYALSYTPPSGQEGIRAIEIKVDGPGYRARCRPSYRYQQRRH
jgi:Ca-activated chloride channel family protein